MWWDKRVHRSNVADAVIWSIQLISINILPITSVLLFVCNFFYIHVKKKLQTKYNTEVIGNILIEIDWTDQITASATLLRWI